ncbi:cytochrome P450, partial [Lentinula edodes]
IPSLEPIINETLRHITRGPLIEQNVGNNMEVDGVTIPHGTYMMLPLCDFHQDPQLYNNPAEFNPEHFRIAREGNKVGFNFLGWGAGSHICIGRHTAILEIKLMIIILIATYKLTVIDESGHPIKTVPRVQDDRLFRIIGTVDKIQLSYCEKH